MLRVSILALALLAAGCAGSDERAVGWSGPAELRPRDGTLEVGAFREHAESVNEDWERDPVSLANAYLRVAGLFFFVFDGSEVHATHDLQDDSIRRESWVLELERDGELWRLVSARWEQQRHRGRGHQDFSPELCV